MPPAALLSFTARQLSGYGIRFASVTEDLLQYQKEDFAVVLLASSRRKADALQAMLREKRVFSAVDERLHDLPAPGRITIAVGGLSAGFDFPDGKFAVLAEGRPCPPDPPELAGPRRTPPPASGWNPSPTWPPGTWWSTSTTASAGLWAW
ncbi:MAG: hypothetical protein ACLTC3_06685 [Evtepia gabavorous]